MRCKEIKKQYKYNFYIRTHYYITYINLLPSHPRRSKLTLLPKSIPFSRCCCVYVLKILEVRGMKKKKYTQSEIRFFKIREKSLWIFLPLTLISPDYVAIMTHTPSRALLLKNRLYLYDGISLHRKEKIFQWFSFLIFRGIAALLFFLLKKRKKEMLRWDRVWGVGSGLCLKKDEKIQ